MNVSPISDPNNRANEAVWKYLQLSREMPMRYYLLKYPSMLPDEDYLFLKILYDIAGGDSIGLKIERKDTERFRLTMGNHGLYLTLEEGLYAMRNEQGEVIESQKIPQNEQGIDTEDRVLVGLRLLNKYLHLYDVDTVRGFISRCEWKFAKTMPQWPHEYIVKNKCPLTEGEFEYLVWTQRTLGQYEDWHSYRQPYLYIDGYKYWTMGCELESTTIINRAKVQ